MYGVEWYGDGVERGWAEAEVEVDVCDVKPVTDMGLVGSNVHLTVHLLVKF